MSRSFKGIPRRCNEFRMQCFFSLGKDSVYYVLERCQILSAFGMHKTSASLRNEKTGVENSPVFSIYIRFPVLSGATAASTLIASAIRPYPRGLYHHSFI